jgi:two-component system C4-dicarboxylate transport response regulator DctD
VRELRNAADCHVLGVPRAALPPSGPLSLAEAVDAFERALIVVALSGHDGHLTRTAEALGIAKSTLHDKMRKHGLLQ